MRVERNLGFADRAIRIAAGAASIAATVDWIACHGDERVVARGRVKCPAMGGTTHGGNVRVQACLECRHLISTPIDRLPEAMCSVDEWLPADAGDD